MVFVASPVACSTCTRFEGNPAAPGGPVWVCTAFPDGIPEVIVSGGNPHLAAVEGDGGLRYDPI